jgi:hypothetical protein
MMTARQRHTATLLTDGRVLVTGGCSTSDCAGATNSAEIYDPTQDTWTAAMSMNTARMFHTATLLPTSGRVLVTGGCVDNSCLNPPSSMVTNSTQEYDPANDVWVMSLVMGSKRFQHSATLLSTNPDIVLVAGGGDGSMQLASAELYSAGWTPTGSMAQRRRAFSATQVIDGRVLAAGGYDGVSLNGAELYSPPPVGTWASAGTMSTPRDTPRAALLLSGQVLVVGGYLANPLATAELYDPATGWSPTASMIANRYYFNLELLGDSRVLAAGAWLPFGYARMSAEIYTPSK